MKVSIKREWTVEIKANSKAIAKVEALKLIKRIKPLQTIRVEDEH